VEDTRIDAFDEGETHATTGGAAIAGAATGGLIGMAAGPVGAAVGAVGGALVGAVSERIMHTDDDHHHTGDDDGHDHVEHHEHLRRNPAYPQTGTTLADQERIDL
jgi:phage tail tape-measure protein